MVPSVVFPLNPLFNGVTKERGMIIKRFSSNMAGMEES